MPRTDTPRSLAYSFAADKFVRRFRVLAAERRFARHAAQRKRRLAAMRFGAMGAICLAATIVLNESANDRWSRFVLGTSDVSARQERAAIAMSGGLSAVPNVRGLEIHPSPRALVTLKSIEDDASAPLVLRPASVTRPREAALPAYPRARLDSPIIRGGQSVLAAAELGGELSRAERR